MLICRNAEVVQYMVKVANPPGIINMRWWSQKAWRAKRFVGCSPPFQGYQCCCSLRAVRSLPHTVLLFVNQRINERVVAFLSRNMYLANKVARSSTQPEPVDLPQLGGQRSNASNPMLFRRGLEVDSSAGHVIHARARANQHPRLATEVHDHKRCSTAQVRYAFCECIKISVHTSCTLHSFSCRLAHLRAEGCWKRFENILCFKTLSGFSFFCVFFCETFVFSAAPFALSWRNPVRRKLTRIATVFENTTDGDTDVEKEPNSTNNS